MKYRRKNSEVKPVVNHDGSLNFFDYDGALRTFTRERFDELFDPIPEPTHQWPSEFPSELNGKRVGILTGGYQGRQGTIVGKTAYIEGGVQRFYPGLEDAVNVAIDGSGVMAYRLDELEISEAEA
jgi:hypothetical protein